MYSQVLIDCSVLFFSLMFVMMCLTVSITLLPVTPLCVVKQVQCESSPLWCMYLAGVIMKVICYGILKVISLDLIIYTHL